jgi:SAM-dependent methyltransferase
MLVALVPEHSMIVEHAGGMTPEDFVAHGESLLAILVAKGLKPWHRVLDIGCGCGKLARPLTQYLDSTAQYDGIDITTTVIDWCRKSYASFPQFHFHHADIASTRYNRNGRIVPADFRFPFPDHSYDLIHLGSVFTHMLTAGVSNYLGEIARLLKPDGRCLVTFFLLDAESRSNMAAGRTSPNFAHMIEPHCQVETPDMPEAAVAYDEAFIRSLYVARGLTITEIVHSHWGRNLLIPHSQDMIWARLT